MLTICLILLVLTFSIVGGGIAMSVSLYLRRAASTSQSTYHLHTTIFNRD